ncbi:hypothetical protein DL96DRAFT_1529897 [Flagelloscypha sp. PMI_526]|nr:hypothetical protein DL96DRAFT_1529897 [Flagelloscypha sp. PMI_526]
MPPPKKEPPSAVAASSAAAAAHHSNSSTTLPLRNSTPQQRLVQILVGRLKGKLPYYSGIGLSQLEEDEAMLQVISSLTSFVPGGNLDIIALALCELLDRLAKLAIGTGAELSVEVLQSQLFVLKVLELAFCVARHETAAKEDGTVFIGDVQGGLDDNCARYIISVMVLFLRQTNFSTPQASSAAAAREEMPLMLPVKGADIVQMGYTDNTVRLPNEVHTSSSLQPEDLKPKKSFASATSGTSSHRDEGVPTYLPTHPSLLRTTLSLSTQIAHYTGLLVTHISQSNWRVLLTRLKSRINHLTQSVESTPSPESLADLHLITCADLDRVRLAQVLSELSTRLLDMKPEVRLAVLPTFRIGIWRWMEERPTEFEEALRTRGKGGARVGLEGAPERLFDLLWGSVYAQGSAPLPQNTERSLWPMLTILHALSPERIKTELNPLVLDPPSSSSRARTLTSNAVLSETALVCGLDICRAAALLPSRQGGAGNGDEVRLRMLATDITPSIQLLLAPSVTQPSSAGGTPSVSSPAATSTSQRAFWDRSDEIDVLLYAAILSHIYIFSSQSDSIPFILSFLEPERSDAVKTCAVLACLMLMKITGGNDLRSLGLPIAPRLRAIFSAACRGMSEQDRYGVMKRSSLRPRARPTPEFQSPAGGYLSEKQILLATLLMIFRHSWNDFYIPGSTFTDVKEFYQGCILRLLAATSSMGGIAASENYALSAIEDSDFSGPGKVVSMLAAVMEQVLPGILSSLARNLIYSRTDATQQRLWLSYLCDLLTLYAMKNETAHALNIVFSPDRAGAFALVEIALCVTLTSHDTTIVHLAGRALRMISHAERNPDPPTSYAENAISSARHPVFEQLGDPKTYMIPSRVALQKKIRRLMKLANQPLAVQVAIWEDGFARWKDLNEKVVSAVEGRMDVPASRRGDVQAYVQELRFQWQHLTLFLAALCGPLVDVESGQDSVQKLSQELAQIVPKQELPDHLRVLVDPSTLVHRFIADLTDLLLAEDVQLREIARDAMGGELSPRWYGRLLEYLGQVVGDIQDGMAGTGGREHELTESYGLFLDQFLIVLTLLVENQEVSSSELFGVDLYSIMHTLSLFTSRFGNSIPIRTRLRFCSLADGLSTRMNELGLLEGPIRSKAAVTRRLTALDILCSWLQQTTGMESAAAALQNEVNWACLKALVKGCVRLRLDAVDGDDQGQGGEEQQQGGGHGAVRLFNKYSKALISTLDILGSEAVKSDSFSSLSDSLYKKMRQSQREALLRSEIITGLAYLVSANPDVGFKQLLPMAYDSDSRRKVIFTQVFAKVVGEGGTRFEGGPEDGIKGAKGKLCELVKSQDLVLTLAICETCSPSEVELMISVLLSVFDTRTELMNLLKAMIDREVAQTPSDGQFFRGNSFYTRFLSAFARIHGYSYLRSLMRPLLKSMENMPGSFDLDAGKVGEEQAQKNQEHVETVAGAFLDIIQASVKTMPGMIRELCSHIAQSVYRVWPESKFVCLGAFVFLRFISPVIVTPSLVDLDIPGDPAASGTIRRGLMVIAKVIQNLANNIFFGKEIHMTVLNDFLRGNIGNVTRYLSGIIKWPDDALPPVEEPEHLSAGPDDTDMIVLHRFFVKHADKIGKELLSSSTTEAGGSGIHGKRAWDGLCTLLVDLGAPIDTPRVSALSSDQHRDFQEVVSKIGGAGGEFDELFVRVQSGGGNEMFILRMGAVDVDRLDVNLAVGRWLATIHNTAPTPFEIVLDLTNFSSRRSELPLQWFKFAIELIPSDLLSRLVGTHILNPNSESLRWLRRAYNVSGGVVNMGAVRVYSSIRDLLEHVPLDDKGLEGLKEPLILEQEESEMFPDVILRDQTQPSMMIVPVQIIVGKTHLRLTHVRSQQIGTGISCRPTEIISLAEVGDVYSVSSGAEVTTGEFIVRRTRGAGTVYFVSPDREFIVKAIRTAKSHLKEVQAPSSADRFSRFSNVPATLIHLGLLNLDPHDEEVRAAAYNLLGQLCVFLNYEKAPVAAVKTGFIPGVATSFPVFYSTLMAANSPNLTIDFLTEVSGGMQSMDRDKFGERTGCVLYMSPWIKNLAMFVDPLGPYFERNGGKVRDCIRLLIEISVAFPELSSTMNMHIWGEIAKLDTSFMDIVIDELIRAAADGGAGSRRCEAVSLTLSVLSSIHVKSRILNKLRKALHKTAPRQFKSFADAPTWNEIATLIRLVIAVAHDDRHNVNNQLFLPEIFHLMTLVSGIGPTLIRKSIYGVLMNLLQALFFTATDESQIPNLMRVTLQAQTEQTLRCFGLRRESDNSEYANWDATSDKAIIENMESLVRFLEDILGAVAGSQGVLNVWRARWMSLVTSTAFQLSPAIQMRSFTAIGLLATSDVDEDFLYQMLVAFKTALSNAPENDTVTVVAMLRSIVRIIPSLPEQSRYPCQLFWLGVALLQSSYFSFFAEAMDLVRISLEVMDSRAEIAEDPTWMESWLWAGRENLDEVSGQLDNLLGLSFEPFPRSETGVMGWSLAALMVKGLRQPALSGVTRATLRSLLDMNVRIHLRAGGEVGTTVPPKAVPYFVALLPTAGTTAEYRVLLQACQVDPTMYLGLHDHLDEAAENAIPQVNSVPLGLREGTSALFCASLVGSMAATAQGDDAESDMLFSILSDIADGWGDVVAMIYDSLQDRITKTFGTSSNASVLRSVSTLFRYSTTGFPTSMSSTLGKQNSGSTLNTIGEESANGPSVRHLNALEEYNIPGLATPLGFVNTNLTAGGGETGRRSWEACMNQIVPGLVGLMIA